MHRKVPVKTGYTLEMQGISIFGIFYIRRAGGSGRLQLTGGLLIALPDFVNIAEREFASKPDIQRQFPRRSHNDRLTRTCSCAFKQGQNERSLPISKCQRLEQAEANALQFDSRGRSSLYVWRSSDGVPGKNRNST